jgi:hypothetical protein
MADLTAGDAWLTSLSDEDALAFEEYVMLSADLKEDFLQGGPPPKELDLFEPLDKEGLSGRQWRDWLGCSVVTAFKPDPRYPRFKVNFTAGEGGIIPTPSKTFRGQPPVGQQVRDILKAAESWQDFKVLAAAGSSKPGKRIVQISCHHIAYRAKAARAALKGEPIEGLPQGAGAGASVSHLCDNPRCVNHAHLVVARTHAANLERQRCTGVTLVVVKGVIVDVVHCPHFLWDDDDGVVVSPDCTRLKIMDLSNLLRVEEDFQEAFGAAHARYKASVAARNAAVQLQSPRRMIID